MLDPDVLVLTEPSSNLDLAPIGLLRKIVAKWKAEGRTVLEHRLHWLEGHADCIIVMRSGAGPRLTCYLCIHCCRGELGLARHQPLRS